MERVGILVGPGVLADVEGLHALADRVGVAVINTWGAKGVFRWDSPFHGGTAGLQAGDFELAGLGDVDLLLTSGLDPLEVTRRPWEGRASVVDVRPGTLAAYASEWSAPRAEPGRPPLYTELAAVVGPMYEDPATPPARLRAIAADATPGTLVVAPPGLAGYWVARTWSTTEPGSVVVPSSPDPTVAERIAVEAAADGRAVTYVTDAPVRLAGVDVVVWGADLTIPPVLLDVAGPLVAWT
jgi:Thiamine pyrophosphate enzyme, central domain